MEMGSIVLHCQSPLRFSSFSAVNKTNLLNLAEIADGALLFTSPKDLAPQFAFSIQVDGDRRSISCKRRISALGRIPKDNGTNAQHLSGAKSSKNQEEIISLLRRIRSSIAKESASLKGRSSKSSDENTSLESVLEVHRQSSTPGKTARKEGNKTSARRRDSSREELKAEFSTRPPSNFVRKSPIPLKSLSLHANHDENRIESLELKDVAIQDIEKMKLPELKELAKSKGIKGYSRLKKAELIKLLSSQDTL